MRNYTWICWKSERVGSVGEVKNLESVGLVTGLILKAGLTPLFDLHQILDEISSEVSLIITKDKEIHDVDFGAFYEINHQGGGHPLFRLMNIFTTQIKISLAIFRLKNVDKLIFFMGGEILILPILLSKILRKKVFLALASSQKDMSQSNQDFFRFFNFICEIDFYLADKIIVYSESLIEEWDLSRLRNKIDIASQHFIDFKKFSKIKEMDERENIIGYVGRLSPEKGVLNLVKSIPLILGEKTDIKFTLIGNGKLMPEIEKYREDNQLDGILNLDGWVNHDELGACLNDFKVLILPSYTEGLPGVILEAMACGTPVLSTPVGSVPDIINNYENGFLLPDNSVNSIKNGVLEVLNYPDLPIISENEIRSTASFTFEQAVNKYKSILTE